ncbi:MAG: hypothetical protein HY532_02175 [Chloroflexi bacterium]|nr:hypothetical protein [Chloroflexota bacterium]
MPACVQMARNVGVFILGWAGMVSGVLVPSGFSRTIDDMLMRPDQLEAQELERLDDTL